MRSIDVANAFVRDFGRDMQLTNLKLNKLVYFVQVESLRTRGVPAFDDAIQAWEYGPVEPAVYRAFSRYGRRPVTEPTRAPERDAAIDGLIGSVARTYGRLSAFDLVSLSHRDGGAWRNRYVPGADNAIRPDDIRGSADMGGFESAGEPFLELVESVSSSIPNAMRMLENS